MLQMKLQLQSVMPLVLIPLRVEFIFMTKAPITVISPHEGQALEGANEKE